MARVLFLTWSQNQPSTKYRVFQYLDGLEQHGFETELLPAGGLTPAKRIRMLQRARAADTVFIQKKLFHPIFLPVLKAANKNLVFDFDDAAFAREPYNPNPRGMSPGSPSSVTRLKAILKNAVTVVAGNSFLASYAAKYNGNVHTLPTPVNTAESRSQGHGKSKSTGPGVSGKSETGETGTGGTSGEGAGGPGHTSEKEIPETTRRVSTNPGGRTVTIGWLGTSKNLYYLNALTGALKQVVDRSPNTRISVISNGRFEPESLRVKNLAWSLEAESEWLSSVDVGIMPLEHDDWSRGKCAFKLLQYMAAGLPTVSSPVGMNAEVVQDGVNGFLADTEDEWREKLLSLVGDPELRERLGRSGRRTVEEEYSLSVCQRKLEEILKSKIE